MGSVSTLPPDLIEQLADLYTEVNPGTQRRYTLRELADVASRDLAPRVVDHMTVRRAIAPILTERAELRREVIRTKALESFGGHFDKLGSLMTKVAKDADDATTASERRKSANVFRQALDTHMKLLGMGERVEVTGALDMTSGGQPLRIYIPAEQPFDDEPDAEAAEAGGRPLGTE